MAGVSFVVGGEKEWLKSMKPSRALHFLLAIGLTLGPPVNLSGAESAAPKPNIVFILADDMGYGDPRCFNPRSRIPTPNIDRLATQGMRFTDAHAPGSVCIPSRYGLLTGRYPFRNTGVRDPAKGAMIEPGRATLATVLRERGYTTAMICKWHLGFTGGDKFDYTAALRGGPVNHGFDSFFGQHSSLDIPPYFFIDNDHCVEAPTRDTEARSTPGWSPIQGAFWRAGRIAPSFKHVDALPTYTRKAVEYLEGRGKAKDGKPFFLYLALTAPHTPWVPMEDFRGKSMGGLYGDFVAQVDDSIGQALTAIDHAGLATNTLVFFASDNGPVWYPEDVKKFGHDAAGGWRGMKGDIWEAGHRMPFIVRWPAKIKAGTTSAETICFTDMLATFAAVSGGGLPLGVGEDSYNLLPTMLAEPHASPLREALVMESSQGVLAIRQGDWKLIPHLGSGGFTKLATIKPDPGDPVGQLYNLAADPGETQNLYAQKPDIVQQLTAILTRFKRPLNKMKLD
jgi:arylsulfatase A-like enzyme